MVTPLLGTPACGQHGFTGVGGSKFHWAAQSTTLSFAHCNENGPVCGAFTVNVNGHISTTPELSDTVTVIGYDPGPTTVPAGGVWLQFSGWGGTAALLKKQFVNWHMSGTTAWQALVMSTACVARHEQSTNRC
jgi:hypothetical protein